MYCSWPVYTKCCFCIPLRPGLLVLAYLRLIFAITALLAVLVVVRVQFSAKELAILFALLALLVANLVFSIIFVVGIHHRDHRLLRVYYSFSIFFMVLTVFLFLCTLVLQAYIAIYYEVEDISTSNMTSTLSSLLDIILQFYFITVIRSQILKFKAEEKVQFTSSNGEARVVLDMPIGKERDVKCDVVYSDSESEEEVILKKPLFPVDELKRLQDAEIRKV